jgi:tetratricopeptide (TPR) repeat protein
MSRSISSSSGIITADVMNAVTGYTPTSVEKDNASQASLIWECADRGEAARARAMCDAEREAAQRSGNSSRIAAVTRIHGELLALRGAGDVAQSEFLRALEVATYAGDKEEEVRIRTALARVLSADGPFDEAESVARSAYDLANSTGDPRARVQALAAWGRALLAQGETKRSVPLFFRAMRTARRTHDDLTLREAWVDLGMALAKTGRSKIAIKLLASANELAEKHGIRRLGLRAQYGLSQALLQDQNASEALVYALSAINFANTYGYEGFLPALYDQLAEVYTQLGDFQGAYYAAKQHIDTQRRRLSSQRRHILMLSSLLIDAQQRDT